MKKEEKKGGQFEESPEKTAFWTVDDLLPIDESEKLANLYAEAADQEAELDRLFEERENKVR